MVEEDEDLFDDGADLVPKGGRTRASLCLTVSSLRKSKNNSDEPTLLLPLLPLMGMGGSDDEPLLLLLILLEAERGFALAGGHKEVAIMLVLVDDGFDDDDNEFLIMVGFKVNGSLVDDGGEFVGKGGGGAMVSTLFPSTAVCGMSTMLAVVGGEKDNGGKEDDLD